MSTPPRSVVPVIVLLLAVAAACWWFAGGAAALPSESGAAPASDEAAPAPLTAATDSPPSTERRATPLRGSGTDDSSSTDTTTADPESLLRGRVLAVGTPLAGAVVSLRRPAMGDHSTIDPRWNAHRDELDEVVTASDGRFEFSVRPGAHYELHAAHPAYAPHTIERAYGGQDVAIELAIGGTVQGRVTFAGQPVPAAHVRGARGTGTVFETETDASGSFSYTPLRPGKLYLDVHPPIAALSSGRSVQIRSGEVTVTEFALREGVLVEGRVLDAESGKPIAGAEVSRRHSFDPAETTDADGRFAMHCKVGNGAFLHARATGYALAVEPMAAHEPVDDRLRLDIELAPGHEATGRIVDARGTPIESAYVAAMGTRSVGRGYPSSEVHSARTGPDGRYRLEGLDPKRPYDLVARKPRFGSHIEPLPAPDRDMTPLELPDIVLTRGGAVRGVLQNERGEPVADAPIEMRGPALVHGDARSDRFERPGSPYSDERSTRTDALGVFRFVDVATGEYEFSTWIDDQTTSARAKVLAGTPTTDVTLVLHIGATITGRVVLPDDVPSRGGQVSARVIGRTPPSRPPTARLRADGSFVLRGLEADTEYELECVSWAPAATTTTTAVSGTTGLEVLLPATVTIRVRILGPDGKPRSDCTVAPNHRSILKETDADGWCTLEVPADRTVDLVVYTFTFENGKRVSKPASFARPERASGLRGPIDGLELHLAR